MTHTNDMWEYDGQAFFAKASSFTHEPLLDPWNERIVHKLAAERDANGKIIRWTAVARDKTCHLLNT